MTLHKFFYPWFFILLPLLFIIIIIIWQWLAYRVAKPDYIILKSDKNIEIRQYPALIVAQVIMEGERYFAINAGFRLLADYIFGNNRPKQKIAMTAPVMQQGVNIRMTVPVTQQMISDRWVVRFVMPADFSMETLPKPNNEMISLLTISPGQYVVIRFSGSNTDKNLRAHQQTLFNYIVKNKLAAVGNPIMAFYNPPWILPFLRRNEIMIALTVVSNP